MKSQGLDVTEATPTIFLTLTGIPQTTRPSFDTPCFVRDSQGAWRPLHGDLLYEIDAECVNLHDAFAAAIFGGLDGYHKRLPALPPFIYEAGLNSESSISRDNFEKFLGALKELPDLYQFLYLYDCCKLVSGIQGCTLEVCFLIGEFYRILNLEEFFLSSAQEPDGVRWVKSPTVTSLTATLNVIYIRLHSLLDYTTKLVFEIEHLRRDFRNYPKLSSSKILFGDRRRTGWDLKVGTLFEPEEPMHEIELVRNLVIHDGLLDDMPKAYKVVRGGKAVEKFVLMPDRNGLQLERYKNRNLFYSREDKVNLRLLSLLEAFQRKQLTTLKLALTRLHAIGEQRARLCTQRI